MENNNLTDECKKLTNEARKLWTRKAKLENEIVEIDVQINLIIKQFSGFVIELNKREPAVEVNNTASMFPAGKNGLIGRSDLKTGDDPA